MNIQEKQGQQGTYGKRICRKMKDGPVSSVAEEWFTVGNKHRNTGTQHHQLPSFNSKQCNLDIQYRLIFNERNNTNEGLFMKHIIK